MIHLSLIFHAVGTESPREIANSVAVWIFGLVCGAMWARRKIVKPAAERHEEIMEAHKAVHDHLGINKK